MQRPNRAVSKIETVEGQNPPVELGDNPSPSNQAPSETVLGIVDVVQTMAVFSKFDSFLACSWPSAYNVSGIVLSLSGLQLQLSMHREGGNLSGSNTGAAAAAAAASGNKPYSLIEEYEIGGTPLPTAICVFSYVCGSR